MKIYAPLRHIFIITVPFYFRMAKMNVMNAFQNIDEMFWWKSDEQELPQLNSICLTNNGSKKLDLQGLGLIPISHFSPHKFYFLSKRVKSSHHCLDDLC